MVFEGVCEILYQGGDCWKLILIFHLEEEVRGVQEEAAKKMKKRKKKRRKKVIKQLQAAFSRLS